MKDILITDVKTVLRVGKRLEHWAGCWKSYATIKCATTANSNNNLYAALRGNY